MDHVDVHDCDISKQDPCTLLWADGDNSQFLNYDKGRFVVPSIFDRTNGTSPGRAQRLSGSATEKVGLAKSFAVMPGDRIRAEVYAKYFDADAPNLDVALQGLLTSLLNPAGSGDRLLMAPVTV